MGEPHEHGFGLIAAMMGREQQPHAIGAHSGTDQPIAGRAGRLLLAGPGLFPPPGEKASGKPQPFGLAKHHFGFAARFGPQPMIEGVNHGRRFFGMIPGGIEQHQRKRIGPAGDGEADDFFVSDRREQPRRVHFA